MITLELETSKLIREEMESIPEKYQKPFNSMHEGLGVPGKGKWGAVSGEEYFVIKLGKSLSSY